MACNVDRVRAALYAKLLTWTDLPVRADTGAPAVAYPNALYTPEPDRVWVAVHFTPNVIQGTGFNMSAAVGLFLVWINVPLNAGEGAATRLQGTLAAHFYRGLRLSSSGVLTTITGGQFQTLNSSQPSWYTQGLNILWSSLYLEA